MDCHFLLQGIFPIQGLIPGLWHCRQTLYRLSHKEGDSEKCLWLLFRPQETRRPGSRKMVGVDEGLGLSRGPDGLHVAKSSSSLTSSQHVTWLTTVSSLVPFFLLPQGPPPAPWPVFSAESSPCLCWRLQDPVLVLFFPPHGHGDSLHLQALNTISVLMVPRCLFNPDVSLQLQTHIQSSPDTSTWVSNNSLEMNMFQMQLLTSPRPLLPAVYPISAMAEHSSQFLAANLVVLGSLSFFSHTSYLIFRKSCWFYLQNRSSI